MNDSAYKISLDINEHGSQVVLKAKQSDTGRKISISLRAGGSPYTIADDCYAVFAATKPDGSILYNACTIEGNEIIYEFTEQTCAAVGRNRCEIKLYGLDDTLITSPRFALLVDGTVYPDGRVESSNEFSALTHLIGDTLAATGNANQAAEAATQATVTANTAADAAYNAIEATVQATANASGAAAAANKANEAAIEATKDANEAAGYATNAAASASLASQNANDAAASANEASNNATLAANNANEAASKASHTAKSLMVVGEEKGSIIALDDAIDQYLVGLHVFGKTTQNGTPTPDAPIELVSVGNSGSICVTASEKNIFQFAGNILMENGSVMERTPTGCVVQGIDGGVTPGSTAWSNGWVHFDRVSALHLTEGTVITLSADYTVLEKFQSANDKVTILLEYASSPTTLDISKAEIGVKYRISKTFVIPDDGKYKRTTFSTHSSKVRIENVQWEIGSTASNFVPYRGNTFSVSTPNGLPGIPVTSGGNYTDDNGQQWICDEIDFVRGVYVQKVGSEKFDGSTDEVWNTETNKTNTALFTIRIGNSVNVGTIAGKDFLCTHFAVKDIYSLDIEGAQHTGKQFYFRIAMTNLNIDGVSGFRAFLTASPMTVQYILETPIETPLSEEELAAYATLHTYRENTTVSNDSGAWMDLEYVMDARKYIDSLVKAPPAWLSNVTLLASAWKGSDGLYSQVVTIDGITEYSKVDLLPSVEQLAIFHNKDVAFVTENEDGVVTVYAIGDKPILDYTMQAQITEVEV